jgi:uncharacterized protein (TIGR03083 family)
MVVAKEAPTYEALVGTLADALHAVEQTLAGLSEQDWRRPTLLEPFDPNQPHWDVLQLVGHFDISIGLTLALVGDPQNGQIGRDRVSFFIADRSQVAPVVYDYAVAQVKDKAPAEVLAMVRQTFQQSLDAARLASPDTVGSGFFALMRLDDFVATRIVEAVVHGMDLTDALGRPPLDLPDANALTAATLDELLARRTVAGRPPDLQQDDLAFIRAASGRGKHPDPRFPLII